MKLSKIIAILAGLIISITSSMATAENPSDIVRLDNKVVRSAFKIGFMCGMSIGLVCSKVEDSWVLLKQNGEWHRKDNFYTPMMKESLERDTRIILQNGIFAGVFFIFLIILFVIIKLSMKYQRIEWKQ